MLLHRGGGRAAPRAAALSWLILTLLALSSCVITPAGIVVDNGDQPLATVQAGVLRVYDGPGYDYASIGALYRHEQAAALGKKEDCRWLYLRAADGRAGWVPAGPLYVSLESACEQVAKAVMFDPPTPQPATPLRSPPMRVFPISPNAMIRRQTSSARRWRWMRRRARLYGRARRGRRWATMKRRSRTLTGRLT